MVYLGGAPMPKNSSNGTTIQDFVERSKIVTPVDWDITVPLSQNAISDDRTGALERRVQQAAENFQLHLNQLVFETLNDGESTTTYGTAYNGLSYFNDSHIDPGANYQTAQDNKYAVTLTMDNYETVRVAHQTVRNDQGTIQGYAPDLIVVPPALERTAAQIATNMWSYDTANREVNPYNGSVLYITAPWLDSTAWFSVVSYLTQKPIILAMREQPHLQSSWFDPTQPDGGMYYFKFFARYWTAYGDWRLCFMGNT
jgi:phage major head subunit gpT-like protein